ncbi:hypothetical protein JM946_00025 [Steroidobacter sp. S1-65]|uniref:PAS domain-containing protein n=1 Tax=Steroidobacter gossypii TaxID=2805490 RepID=A0ABS1WQ51_9GAMM|nr:hypothetical protein [Steroidobacter gossypii]MBM0103105.1 hypothetical protein [Steroidobacter gossypii]
MNVFRMHRGGRAPTQASGIAHRRLPATVGRLDLERIGTSAGRWTIPSHSNVTFAPQGSEDWRHRLLTARGEQIHMASMHRNDRSAIAILDATGIVISWHDNLPRARPYDSGVLSRHVSQFYLPHDVASRTPARHLTIAAEHGVDTQHGWRRRPAGEIFWGVTILQSILLGDGELVGYSHVTRTLRAPAQVLAQPLRAQAQHTACLAAPA